MILASSTLFNGVGSVTEILQLKPKENSFYKMARDVTGRLEVIFLCEGKRDSEVLKSVASKVFNPQKGLAVTDCEGKDAITEIAVYIATLATVSRTLRDVPIIIDADKQKPKDRAESICNSLRARVGGVELVKISGDVFEIRSGFKVRILVKVVGDLSLPYEKHTIDDHVLRLLMLENLIDEGETKKYDSAKECVDEFIESNNTSVKEIILKAQPENVQKALRNLVKYLETIFDS